MIWLLVFLVAMVASACIGVIADRQRWRWESPAELRAKLLRSIAKAVKTRAQRERRVND